MKINRPRVLIISSADPFNGPGVIASDLWQLHKSYGIECDLLTLYAVPKHPDILYIYKFNSLKDKLSRIWRIYFKSRLSRKGGPHYFFYKNDDNPPIPVSHVLHAIKKNYDYVKIVFHQEMLSFKTIEAIYDKLHCLIHIVGVDYAYITGGCHHIGECERYKFGCGKCPAWKSDNPNDFTHKNCLYRRRIYEKVKPVLGGNFYMYNNYYKNSFVIKNYDRIVYKKDATLNTELFKPRYNDNELRKKREIESDKFVIFFACQNVTDERKGFSYLLKSLMYLSSQLSNQQKESIILLTAGNLTEDIAKTLPFEVKNLGFLSTAELAISYSLANVFICPAINDAGPMMVWQSLVCGTPVVGFEMGACLEAVKNMNTGYSAKLCDSEDLAKGIMYIYEMFRNSPDDYIAKRKYCAEFAYSICSPDATFKRSMAVYEKYKC